MPGAVWIGPSPNITPGGMGAVFGLVLHIQAGSESGTEAWEHNPSAQVSSHFLAPRAGGVRQMVRPPDEAWCQAAGNRNWLSVECEGRLGDTLTPAQVDACAWILAWAHALYGVPLRLADDPTPGSVAQGGLAYHSLGGVAWSPAHHNCPGPLIVAQRPAILTRAAELVAPSTGGTPVADDAAHFAQVLLDTPLSMGSVRDYLGRLNANYTRYDKPLSDLAAAVSALSTQVKALGTAAPVHVPTAAEIAAEIIRQLKT